ncbi:MAG: hypothetical protein H0T78_05945 [Longispora sp.]|nr:hypothetical protein [Longispora sp. (in: high G+C Gram-positive bacteria)]
MRWLTFLGFRYGIALALSVLIAGFVLTLRLVAPESSTPGQPFSDHSRTLPADPHEQVHEGDDLTPIRTSAQPVTSPGAAPPEVVAKTFAQAWVRHTGVSGKDWLAGLSPYATTELRSKLTDTDPAAVPAERVTGEPQAGSFASQSFVEYTLTLDSGTLVLRLIRESGQWKVDTIDWERAR